MTKIPTAHVCIIHVCIICIIPMYVLYYFLLWYNYLIPIFIPCNTLQWIFKVSSIFQLKETSCCDHILKKF